MSCDSYEVGTRVEAVIDFQIQEALAAPVAATQHQIHTGETGEVTQKRIAGNFHWLIIRWDRMKHRTLNLQPDQFEHVKIIS
ncbi:MAG: hypothetical protein IIB30_02350 [Chloroflexi bacterium]|nr:hypothetical protein [Chloroflexota bacterium]MCI0845878.1 hypothetical protein [Chloroflexota bacterium]